jgi:[citrate (pro-3S)-lyase] ligase
MNCNPFTLGHQHLIQTAASECDRLYVFVLSEDKSQFSAADRLALVKAGTAHLPNVTVLPTGPYLISSATFPTYFLKDREQAGSVQCSLDIEIFARYYAPHFGITHRFVGTEPLSPMTGQYNEALKAHLPERGIVLTEIPRLETGDAPISATAVRQALDEGKDFRHLVPDTTYEYLIQGGFCHA